MVGCQQRTRKHQWEPSKSPAQATPPLGAAETTELHDFASGAGEGSHSARLTNSTPSKSKETHLSEAQQQQQSQHPILQKQKTLKRQATRLIVKRRADQQSLDSDTKTSRDGIGAAGGETTGSSSNTQARIVPTRFLYGTTRWKQSVRCDYCNFAGGDLECATCDVIAHARCYLSACDSIQKKTKGACVVPTRFSWLCFHCQRSLQEEYDERSKRAHAAHRHAAPHFRQSRDCVRAHDERRDGVPSEEESDHQNPVSVLRQACSFAVRSASAHVPQAVGTIKVRGLNGDRAGLALTTSASTEDLRLSNGSTCNPYVYVSIVDGKDDENQLFCFETSLQKGISIQDPEVCWSDKLFVPGVDGNVTLCFTLLSKTVPTISFSDKRGITTELSLSEEVEIFPKTTQHQPLHLVEVGGSAQKVSSLGLNTGKQQHQHSSGLFANSNSFSLALSVHIKPFSDVHSYCGYMGMKNTLDSFQTSLRWCVLADGVLRIYRHFGVTLASDVVDMAHTIEIKLVEASKVTNNGVFHREQNCIAIQHVNRLYLLQCDQRSSNKVWLKKLQAATKFGASTAVDQASSSSLAPLSNHSSSQ